MFFSLEGYLNTVFYWTHRNPADLRPGGRTDPQVKSAAAGPLCGLEKYLTPNAKQGFPGPRSMLSGEARNSVRSGQAV